MSRRDLHSVPSYRLHKQSGQAVVTLNRKDFLLGEYDTAASKEKYKHTIVEWLKNGRQVPVKEPAAITIAELIDAYFDHALVYYRKRDGTLTSESNSIRTALRAVRSLYGNSPVSAFGPLELKVVRQSMIEKGWVRSSINKQIQRVRRMFNWAIVEKGIPSSIREALAALPGLSEGRSTAIEANPKKPVPIEHIEAVLRWAPEVVRTMAQVQMLTGMRPGEVCQMRPCDLDRSAEVWVYTPADHKNSYRGQGRFVLIGPRAQSLLLPFLLRAPDAYLFSPAESEKRRREIQHLKRRTPSTQGNVPGSNRAAAPKFQPTSKYAVAIYRRAITRACDRANEWTKGGMLVANEDRIIPRWHPHQLRHNAGTMIRSRFGIEASRVVLGHKCLEATELYAEKDVEAAKRVMAQVG